MAQKELMYLCMNLGKLSAGQMLKDFMRSLDLNILMKDLDPVQYISITLASLSLNYFQKVILHQTMTTC